MEQANLSLGGEVRAELVHVTNEAWQPIDGDRFGLLRTSIHADLRFGSNTRLFGQLKSGLEDGRRLGPRQIDEDKLDLGQAFLEVGAGELIERPVQAAAGQPTVPAAHQFAMRLGRQELRFGSGRMIDVREGPNVRDAWDGGRLSYRQPGWTAEAFLARPVSTNRGIFDDKAIKSDLAWGIYGAGAIGASRIDLYYFGYGRDRSIYDQGVGKERRHTLGLRTSGAWEGYDAEGEFAYQFGSFGSGKISAWTAVAHAGYTLIQHSWRPRFGLRVGVASGDKDPNDATLSTFDAPSPTGFFFGPAAPIGPSNLIALSPSISASPLRRLTLGGSLYAFWRESVRDGLYNSPGILIRSGRNSPKRFVALKPELSVHYQADRRTRAVLMFARVSPGAFLRDTGSSEPIDYVEATIGWRL